MATAALTGPTPTTAPGSGGGGVTSHGALTGRTADNQHPISSVTGLTEALAATSAVAAVDFMATELLDTVLTLINEDGSTMDIDAAEAPADFAILLLQDRKVYTTTGTGLTAGVPATAGFYAAVTQPDGGLTAFAVVSPGGQDAALLYPTLTEEP